MEKKKALILGVTLWLAALVSLAAPPPKPYDISGYVFLDNGSQAPENTTVRVYNLNSGSITEGLTGTPVDSGYYSFVLIGSNNDPLTVRAWNATSYGEQNASLGNRLEVNITINTTRPAEMNLTIVEPQQDSLFNITDSFLLNVSINVLGGANATNCSLAVSFNSSVLGLAQGESMVHNYSSLQFGTTFFETWNFTMRGEGSTNVTVNSSCDSDSLNLENLLKGRF